jgi:Phasin protein
MRTTGEMAPPRRFGTLVEALMTTTSDNAAQQALNWIPAAFDTMGRKQYETAFALQKELLDTFEQINRAWFVRAQSEIDLAAEFIGKVAGTRSIPDMANAYQECVSRQLEMLAEDSRRILADGEKLLRAGTRHLANGSGESASRRAN